MSATNWKTIVYAWMVQLGSDPKNLVHYTVVDQNLDTLFRVFSDYGLTQADMPRAEQIAEMIFGTDVPKRIEKWVNATVRNIDKRINTHFTKIEIKPVEGPIDLAKYKADKVTKLVRYTERDFTIDGVFDDVAYRLWAEEYNFALQTHQPIQTGGIDVVEYFMRRAMVERVPVITPEELSVLEAERQVLTEADLAVLDKLIAETDDSRSNYLLMALQNPRYIRVWSSLSEDEQRQAATALQYSKNIFPFLDEMALELEKDSKSS